MYLNIVDTIHPLFWSCQSNLHLRSAMKNTNTPLDGAYLVDFGIEVTITATDEMLRWLGIFLDCQRFSSDCPLILWKDLRRIYCPILAKTL